MICIVATIDHSSVLTDYGAFKHGLPAIFTDKNKARVACNRATNAYHLSCEVLSWNSKTRKWESIYHGALQKDFL